MSFQFHRRSLLKQAAAAAGTLGLGAASAALQAQTSPSGGTLNSRRICRKPEVSRVALIKGNDRRENMVQALERIAPQIKAGVQGKQVVIKPNFTRVKKEEWLASTHVDGVSALCEVLSSFYKGRILIAEGTGPGTPLQEAVDSYQYSALQKRFPVEFFDLRSDEQRIVYILDPEMAPVPVRTSRLLLDPDTYLVSAAVLKTHTLAAVTLGLKNIVLAAPCNNGVDNDRRKMHAGVPKAGPRAYNYNLFQMGIQTAPDLVLIDGFVGMEGEGPLNGTAVESKVAVASTDWLAADRVGTELMGFDFARIGHLRYCAQAGMGEGDLSRIQLTGEPIGNCRRAYQPPASLPSILM